jgi:hypothetical protein
MADQGGISSGAALRAVGPPATGIIGFPDAKVGKVYRFAFPLMKNASKDSVTVTGVSITGVPTAVTILGYPVYSTKDTPGYLLAYRDSDHHGGPNDGGANLDKYPNYAGHPFVIKPGALSEKYAMVRLRVTGKVSKHVTGCEVDYTQAGHAYQQTLHCEYALDTK